MQASEDVICLDYDLTDREAKANIRRWIGHPRFEQIRYEETAPNRLVVPNLAPGPPALRGCATWPVYLRCVRDDGTAQ